MSVLAQVSEVIPEVEEAVQLASESGYDWEQLATIVGSIIGVNLVAGLVAIKAFIRRIGGKEILKRMPQVLNNLEALTEKSLTDIVSEGVHNEINGSLVDIKDDVCQLKQDHESMRTDIAQLKADVSELKDRGLSRLFRK